MLSLMMGEFMKKLTFEEISQDIINKDKYLSLKNDYHHGLTRYIHSIRVAKYTYKITKLLHLNYINATRGALLHDYFLYDWHVKDKSHRLHGYIHPRIASINAKKICNVNDNVAKIINTHMWPLTLRKIPLSKEAFIVCIVDKYVALKETFKIA